MNVSKLSDQEKEAVIEEYLGVHPKYFYYDGNNLKFDVSQMEVDGLHVGRFGPFTKGIHYKQLVKSGIIVLPL